VEAVINDADGYYGGAHNFYLYDQGPAGYVWLGKLVDRLLEVGHDLVTFRLRLSIVPELEKLIGPPYPHLQADDAPGRLTWHERATASGTSRTSLLN
jgi:hypothetical protein